MLKYGAFRQEGEEMLYTPMKIKDAFVVDLTPIGDSRGFFSRVFVKKICDNGLDPRVMQSNNSFNAEKGTRRATLSVATVSGH